MDGDPRRVVQPAPCDLRRRNEAQAVLLGHRPRDAEGGVLDGCLPGAAVLEAMVGFVPIDRQRGAVGELEIERRGPRHGDVKSISGEHCDINGNQIRSVHELRRVASEGQRVGVSCALRVAVRHTGFGPMVGVQQFEQIVQLAPLFAL